MVACSPREARPEVSIMNYNRTRTARPANVTDTPLASDALVPAVLRAPGPTPTGRSADWALTDLYSRHYRALVRLAVLLVRDVPTAEDVVQDSFAAMHDGWQRLRDADCALAYLRHAVLNRSRSVLRRRAVADKHLPNPPPDMPSAEHDAMAISPVALTHPRRRCPSSGRSPPLAPAIAINKPGCDAITLRARLHRLKKTAAARAICGYTATRNIQPAE